MRAAVGNSRWCVAGYGIARAHSFQLAARRGISQLSHELREGSSPDLVRRRWIIGLKLAGAALGKNRVDVAMAAELAREEWAENKALCAYCQTATLCSVAALAVPDSRTGRTKLARQQRRQQQQ